MRISEARRKLASRFTTEVEEIEEEVEHGVTSRRLREVLAERAISFRTMDTRLRIVVAVALVQCVTASVFVGLRDAGLPSVAVGVSNGEATTVSKAAFWLVVCFIALSWSYFLAGLLHAHRYLRVIGLGVFTLAIYEVWDGFGGLGGFGTWRMAPSYALLAAVWLIALFTFHPEVEKRRPVRIQLFVFPLLFALVLGLFLAYWWRLWPTGDPRFFTMVVSDQLYFFTFGLTPLLFMSGIDFAEWGDVTSARVVELLGAWKSVVPLAAATGVLSAVVLADRIDHLPWTEVYRSTGFAVLFALIVSGPALLAARARVTTHVPYATSFAGAMVLAGLIVGVTPLLAHLTAAQRAAAATSTLVHPSAPAFQVKYPVSWQERELDTKNAIRLYAIVAPLNGAQFYIVYLPKQLAGAAGGLLGALFKARPVATGRDGPWQRTTFVASGKKGIGWQRTVKGAVWLLAGVTTPTLFKLIRPIFDAITMSWTPHPTATAEEPAPENQVTVGDRVVTISAYVWGGLGLAGAAFLFFLRRHRRPRWATTTALFMVVAGAFWVLTQLPTIEFTLWRITSVPHLNLGGLQVFTGIATILFLTWLAATARLTPRFVEPIALLLVLNGSLLAVQWIDNGISGDIEVSGRFGVVAAVLVLVAMGWDIAMSGEAVTNRHSHHFPRHTRVLVYLGYVMLLMTAVMFFSSMHVQSTGSKFESGFESDQDVEIGLLFFGVSFILTLFLMRLGRFMRAFRARAD